MNTTVGSSIRSMKKAAKKAAELLKFGDAGYFYKDNI